MSEQAEPEFYDDGSSVWPLERGGLVAFGPSGEPLQAIDETGADIDHTGIVHPDLEDAGGYEDPAVAELQADIDALNERITLGLEAPIEYAPPTGPLTGRPDLTGDGLVAHWHHGIERIEAAMGRTLLDRERAQLARRAMEAGHGDLVRAAEELAEEGRPLRHFEHDSDMANHEARSAHMAERLAELTGEAPDPVTGATERRAEVYDASTHSGRVDAVMD